MKLTAIFLLAACLNVHAHGYAQKLSLSEKNVSLEKVFTEIKRQTGYTFVSTKELLQKAKPVTIIISNASIDKVLNLCFKNQPLHYTIINKTVVVMDKKESAPQKESLRMQVADTSRRVSGTVMSKGAPVGGASVQVEGLNRGTTTDDQGGFVLNNIPAGAYTLQISHVGYSNLKKKITVADRDVALNLEMPSDPLELQQVIMTSTGSPKRKIESSVAITTVSASTLENRAPVNSVDVIKAIPGVFAANGGGDGPGAVRVRGLPSGGGYQFFGVMEDGLPVLPTGFNNIPSADQNFKPDLTIKTIEAIRGGNAPLVMANTSGALMNNISYTGAQKTYGKFKLTTGLSQEMYRADANVGGSISKKVKYNIGGFYRTDKGIRPPSYTANQGGQLKANFTWNFNDKGYIRVYTKYLNDRTQFLLATFYPYNKEHKGDPLPYFDTYTETLIPSQTQFDIRLPDGTIHRTNLEDGYRTKMGYGGFQFHYNVKGWNINNNFRYQYNDISATFPTPTGAVAFAANRRYYYTDGTQLVNPTGYYTTQQLTDAKRLEAQIIDYIDFTKKAGRHSITLGGGIHSYKVISHQGVNSVINTEIKNQPRVIVLNSPTGTVANAAANNNPQGHTMYDGVTNISSVYALDEWALTDELRLEAGIRVDHFNLNGNKAVYSGSSVSSGGTGYKITGMMPWSNSETYWSASVAANYKVNNSLAFFIRGTRSYNAFDITDFTAVDFNQADLKKREILMSELGAKYAKGKFSLFSSVAYTSGKNLPQPINIPTSTGSFIQQSVFASSRSIGWETEASYQLLKGLNLRLTTTIQDPTFTDYKFIATTDARPDIAGKNYDWSGKRPQATPNWNFQLEGTYNYKIFNVFANALRTGDNWSTSANTYKIPAYTEVTAGIGAKLLQKKVELRTWANNLLNSRSLHQGNPRGDAFLVEKDLVIGQPMIGRTILPRSFWISAAYSF